MNAVTTNGPSLRLRPIRHLDFICRILARCVTLDVQHRSAFEGVDLLHFDDVLLDGDDFAECQGDEIRSERGPSGEDACERVFLVPAGMHLEDRPLLGRVVLVEPPDDLHVRPLIQAEHARLEFFVKDDQRAVARLPHVADGVDLVLDRHGLPGFFSGRGIARKNSGGQEDGDGEVDHDWLQLTDLVGRERSDHFTPNLRVAARVLLAMDTTLIKTKFEKLGARARVRPFVRNRGPAASGQIVIDVRHDRYGEFFDIQADGAADVEVLDVQPKDRHLLLMVRRPNQRPGQPDAKDKFLCGHDERHWFVAGVPEKAPVSSVVTAKEALKPDLVRDRERGKKGKRQKRLRRKTDVFVRQGEWFFIPAPNVQVDEKSVLSREPISRGRGKPHMCEELYRDGGITVYVCSQYPIGLTAGEYRRLLKENPAAAEWSWRTMARNPVAYVRGKVWHPDHATIRLDGWHRVEMNTENRSRAMASVAFLD